VKREREVLPPLEGESSITPGQTGERWKDHPFEKREGCTHLLARSATTLLTEGRRGGKPDLSITPGKGGGGAMSFRDGESFSM